MFPKYYNHSTLSTLLPNTDSSHMFNYIRQNEVNVANKPLKVEKPHQESSTERDNFTVYKQHRTFPDTKLP